MQNVGIHQVRTLSFIYTKHVQCLYTIKEVMYEYIHKGYSAVCQQKLLYTFFETLSRTITLAYRLLDK